MFSVTLFETNGQLFAYETNRVVQTDKVSDLHPVPLAPDYIEGVINLRNNIIPVVSVSKLLWGEESVCENLIIVESKGSQIGLLVENIIGLTNVEISDIKLPEDISLNVDEKYVRGVFEYKGKIVVFLNIDHIILGGSKSKRRSASSKRVDSDKGRIGRKGDEEGYVIFKVSNEWFAFNVREVSEIIEKPKDISKIPHAPSYLEGVFILREKEIALYSVCKLLDLKDSEINRVIIANIKGRSVGFGVDEVKEIRWISKEELIYTEEESGKGIIALDDGSRLVLILIAADLIDMDEVTLNSEGKEDEKEREDYKMHKFLVFSVENINFALPINSVKEVIEVDNVNILPNAPQYVDGVYNLRNTVIAVISLRKKFDMKDDNKGGKVVVLEDKPVGLKVDDLKGILNVNEERIQSARDIIEEEDSAVVNIINSEDGSVIFVLDPEAVVSESDLSVLKEKLVGCEDGGKE